MLDFNVRKGRRQYTEDSELLKTLWKQNIENQTVTSSLKAELLN